jgi:hypothetical protein
VDVEFDAAGNYRRFDSSSPLTTSAGKGVVVATLALPRPALAVGDGHTDLAMRPVVDSFAAFTGFIARSAVVQNADCEVKSFQDLATVVLGG